MAIKTEKDIQKLVLMAMNDQIKKIDEKITYSSNLDKVKMHILLFRKLFL